MNPILLALAATTVPAVAMATEPGVLIDATGNPIGAVQVVETPHGVLLRVEARGLPSGWHVHFHEKGDCSDAAFKAAGAHVHAATPVIHGFLVAEANDAGDLPNLYVGPDGTATAEFHSTLVSLAGAGSRPALKDSDGAAVVIHANPDDYRSQPIGGAGERIACAVIP